MAPAVYSDKIQFHKFHVVISHDCERDGDISVVRLTDYLDLQQTRQRQNPSRQTDRSQCLWQLQQRKQPGRQNNSVRQSVSLPRYS